MRVRGIAIAIAALGIIPSVSRAQQSLLPADHLEISGSHSFVWSSGSTNIVELAGPVEILLDKTRLTADQAVIWMRPDPNGLLDEQRVQIALMGHAQLMQDQVIRTDTNLLVSALVRGAIRLTGERATHDDSGSDLFRRASAVAALPVTSKGNDNEVPSEPIRRWSETPTPYVPPEAPGPPPILPKSSIEFEFENFDTERTNEGKLAAVVTGGITLRFRDVKGNLLEFQSDRVVLFTNLTNIHNVDKGKNSRHFITDHLTSAYFEGDVRVFRTPVNAAENVLQMRADRVYYEFATDRAVLTNVVLHTVDVKMQIPIFIRAQTMRQLSQGEYKVENLQLTTSAFATPSYSISASNAYVRTEATGDSRTGDRVSFSTDNTFFRLFGIPVFYLPTVGGTMTARGSALRGISVDDDSDYGFGLRTQWGLFESLGHPAPKDLDAAYRLDYFSKRGPGGGLDAKYGGGFVTETTKDPWNFLGDLHAYFVDDHGTDDLGALRTREKPTDEFRGRAYIEHQHFFPDDWQAQLRFGWVSDANFLTQWFTDEYWNNPAIDESVYLKHQKDSEVFSLLAEWQPNDVVTTADNVPEQREIERLPQVSYYRVGDSFADDSLTFFSENTAAGLDFRRSGATLAQQGFNPSAEPGLPAFAYTGDPGTTTWRGDFRQEVDWPVNAGAIKAVPYVFGRYTVYSQGVHETGNEPATKSLITTPIETSSDQNRLMAGAGLKLTTAFWKVDDSAESDLFDIHRIRHVIEPEIDLFTSAQTVDQSHLFIYDPNVDAINDIQAAQVAIRQRWQTKRGGPGRWRSVDFFTLDVYGDFFANQPDARFRDPVDFRGLYFASEPEASLARNSINANAQWRLSDNTEILADMSHNLDTEKFATGSIGVAVQRDERLSYFIGNRYIADLNSNITTVDINYELTRKWAIAASQSFDFSRNQSVYYTVTLTRKFDRFWAGVRVYYDQTTNDKGFSFNFTPLGLGRGVGTDQATTLAEQNR